MDIYLAANSHHYSLPLPRIIVKYEKLNKLKEERKMRQENKEKSRKRKRKGKSMAKNGK